MRVIDPEYQGEIGLPPNSRDKKYIWEQEIS